MYIMAGLLVIGFICNFLVKAVDKKYHMKREEGEAALDVAGEAAARA
jgi:hypothetical protein